MSNNDPRASAASGGGGSGIAQSTPLVTIPQTPLPGLSIPSKTNTNTTAAKSTVNNNAQPATTSVSGSDHPLAAVAGPPTTHHQDQSFQTAAPQDTYSADRLSQNIPISLSLSPAPPPMGPSTVAVPKVLNSTPTLSQQHLNADELADAFLTGDVGVTERKNPLLLRPLPLPETQTDLERMRVLVERRAWGDVLSMAASLLKGASSHYAAIYSVFLNKGGKSKVPASLLNSQQLEEFMEILILQGHAWIQMRRYKELGAEVQEWSYCHYNRNDSNEGDSASWIPWNIHIFAAASLQYTSQDKSATTTALWQIRHDLEKQMPSTVLHMIHLDHTLSNVFCVQGEWRMALESLERLIHLVPQGVAQVLARDSHDPVLKPVIDACQCEIMSRQGRSFLQIGAIEGARYLFEQVDAIAQSSPRHDDVDVLKQSAETARIIRQLEPQLQANFGLLQFAYQKYNLALEHFRKALQLMEASEQIFNRKYVATDWIGGGLVAPVARHCLYSEVTSNLAVTALYTCRLQEAVHVMEQLVRRNPSESLTERCALNLCTLYELSGDAASATRKKRTLQLIAKRFFLHDIGPESFRL